MNHRRTAAQQAPEPASPPHNGSSGFRMRLLFFTSSPPITTVKYFAISSASRAGATNGVGCLVTSASGQAFRMQCAKRISHRREQKTASSAASGVVAVRQLYAAPSQLLCLCGISSIDRRRVSPSQHAAVARPDAPSSAPAPSEHRHRCRSVYDARLRRPPVAPGRTERYQPPPSDPARYRPPACRQVKGDAADQPVIYP